MIKNNRVLALLITALFILSSVSTAEAQMFGQDTDHRKNWDEEFARKHMPDMAYNETLYGQLIYMQDSRYIDTSLYKMDKIKVDPGERRKISFSLEYDIEMIKDLNQSKFTGGGITPTPLRFRFIVWNMNWDVNYAKKRYNQRYNEIGKTINLKSVGENVERAVRYGHTWFTNLPEKTKSVYELDAPTILLDSENRVKNSSLSFSIKQAGDWAIGLMVKPVEGNYWMTSDWGLSVEVTEPSNKLRKSLFILFPAVTILLILEGTLSIVRRKNTLEKILRKIKVR